MEPTFQEASQAAAGAIATPRALDPGAMPVRLTPTQLKVMRGVRCGQLIKQIAFELGIAEATVKAHMTALMRKLKVRNRTQVAIAAQALSLAAF
ncbi:MAG: LuxR family transcriptional regulator [Alphaproteobacteria bacterium]|nr:LuxR family transcriptional regulator [Alphaproteobacteria bacterium]